MDTKFALVQFFPKGDKKYTLKYKSNYAYIYKLIMV